MKLNYKILALFISCIIVIIIIFKVKTLDNENLNINNQIINSNNNSNLNQNETETKDFDYNYDKDLDGIIILSYLGNESEVIIPSQIDNKDVVAIGEDIFYNNTKIKSINLPKTLSQIEGYYKYVSSSDTNEVEIFEKCQLLESINVDEENQFFTSKDGVLYNKNMTILYKCPPIGQKDYIIPDTVKIIYDYAFSNQSKIEKLKIPDTVDYIGQGAFLDAVSIKNIELSSNITKIQDYTFNGSGIENLDVPEGIKYLGEFSFNNCKNLKTLKLPKSLSDINNAWDFSGFFEGCINLEDITVADGNLNLYSSDGILFGKRGFSKDSYEIICYPPKKEGEVYILPENIHISTHAFFNCLYLKKVIISEGVNYLHNGFSNCKDMIVQVPRSVTSLPDEVHILDFALFQDCENCKVLAYKDSYMEQFYNENSDILPYGCEIIQE